MSRRSLPERTLGPEPPQGPFDRRWYIHVDNQISGPYSGNEIRLMAGSRQIFENDLVYPERGTEWVQAKDDPTLRSLFNKSLTPRDGQRSRWLCAKGAVLAVGVLFFFGFAWIIWPYYAFYKLTNAFRTGDIPALESGVQWTSVREGLRSDLNADFLKFLSNSKKGDELGVASGNGFAAVLAPAMINQLVEGYVTPSAIAAVGHNSNGMRINGVADGPSNFSQTLQTIGGAKQNEVEYMFFSEDPFTFEVQIRPEHDPPYQKPVALILNWSGRWKLTRILLPSDLFDGVVAAAARKEGNVDQTVSPPQTVTTSVPQAGTKSALEPSLFEFKLLSKGFKNRNIQASDFEDDITFKLLITNLSDKDIRAFDGVVTFTDLLDNKIVSLKLAINDPLKSNSTINWDGAIRYNQFKEDHQHLRNEAKSNLKMNFIPRKILFADGTTKEYGQP
jgi:hypothetical protein